MHEFTNYLRCLLVAACLLALSAISIAQDVESVRSNDPMMDLLQKMVEKDPGRADSWRMIGRIHRKEGRVQDAIDCYRRALSLQPDNAAAHYDYAEILVQTGNDESAAVHLDQVMLLAPASSYAKTLVEQGIRPAPKVLQDVNATGQLHSRADAIPSSGQSVADRMGNYFRQDGENQDAENIEKVGYEIPSFDGADDLETRLNQLDVDAAAQKRFNAFIEFGSLYNTNVALTPISRELTGEKSASFQGFLSPDLEWSMFQNDSWRGGPLLRGYFSVNEHEFKSLNLSSFQPGVFVEKDLRGWGDSQMIGRLDYVYALDLLDGDRFGDRHGITGSLTTILPDFDVIYAYVSTNMSNFAEDGADPNVDSLDGTSVTAGISRFFRTDLERIPTWSLGADIESADTEGDDFRYQAVNLHGDMTFQIAPRLSFVPRAGIGYRNYGDFTGPVSRDELTWRAGCKTIWKMNDSLSVSLVVGHNRFASDNQDFDTDRTEGGIVFTFLR